MSNKKQKAAVQVQAVDILRALGACSSELYNGLSWKAAWERSAVDERQWFLRRAQSRLPDDVGMLLLEEVQSLRLRPKRGCQCWSCHVAMGALKGYPLARDLAELLVLTGVVKP